MNEERMTTDERYKYLRAMQRRYKEAKRPERSQLLDEMETVTGLHRKSLIRLMKTMIIRKTRQQQRGKKYGYEVKEAIRVIAKSMDYPCAERLQPGLRWMADHLVRHNELEISADTREKLSEISISTVQRCMNAYRAERKLPPRRVQQSNRIFREVPAGRMDWNEKEPGHFEVDLVHHCDNSVSGQYVHTLQMIDIATGWSERVAVLGRSYAVMEDGFERILARLPFAVKEIHPDNGSEFFNDHMMEFWYGMVPDVRLSRSRPWQKNDNRFVEQKNDTLVRAYLGYRRLDTVGQTNLCNQLYDLMWLYYNFFQPVMRLSKKERLPSTGKRIRTKRYFDTAKTPFERLVEKSVLDEETLNRLRSLYEQTNPLKLRHQIYDLIYLLMNLPPHSSEAPLNVFDTIGLWKCGQHADPHFHSCDDDDRYPALFQLLYLDRKECLAR